MADFYRDLYPRFNNARYEILKDVFKIDDKKQLRKFSKGMKKQVAFWLSLCAMPDLLILDEPLDGLDPVMRKQVLNLVISDVAERGLTVLVSSHNLRELEDICDHVGIIHNGEMILEKPLHKLLGSVYKYQLAFKEDVSDKLENIDGILNISKTGSVYSVIVKAEFEDTEEKLKALSPVLMEKISLTLEEIFIYELGGLGYDFANIIL
jgi:ABC-2 type transport system ATP-binding protein